MNREEKLNWYKNEFENIHKSVKDKKKLSYFDFLRIKNFKLQNPSTENEKHLFLMRDNAKSKGMKLRDYERMLFEGKD